MKDNFYTTDSWRILRRKVLKIYGDECMNCGLSPNETGKSPHVDHIKPRSLYPHLKLEIKNLQILCEECNTTLKSTHVVDYRTNKHINLLERFLNNGEIKSVNQTEMVPDKKEEDLHVVCKRELIKLKNFRSKKKLKSKRKEIYNNLVKRFGVDLVFKLAKEIN